LDGAAGQNYEGYCWEMELIGNHQIYGTIIPKVLQGARFMAKPENPILKHVGIT